MTNTQTIEAPATVTAAHLDATQGSARFREFVRGHNNTRGVRRILGEERDALNLGRVGATYEVEASPFAMAGICRAGFRAVLRRIEGTTPNDLVHVWVVARVLNIPVVG